jgi:K+-transporting ATPase ATPase B chain
MPEMNVKRKVKPPMRNMFRGAARDAFVKLDPRRMIRNPVMFTVEVVSVLTTGLWVQALMGRGELSAGFIGQITAWLWVTVISANFSEALAESRGKARAEDLRRTRQETQAKRIEAPAEAVKQGKTPEFALVASTELIKENLVLVEAGDLIPADGEVVQGIASVDESAVTGESAPVIRESGGDRSAVTGGTKVLSDWLIVRVTAEPGEGFLDRMIGLVEGAKRQKTPNEIALNILLAAFTILPGGLRDALAVLVLQRESDRTRLSGSGDGPGGVARLSDPDYHRRAPIGHRDRRDGPPYAVQRHRHVGQGG